MVMRGPLPRFAHLSQMTQELVFMRIVLISEIVDLVSRVFGRVFWR
jgi:hypothetical protein